MNYQSQEKGLDVLTVTLNPAVDHTVQVEEFSLGQVNRAVASNKSAGGKGVNVAAVLADAGHRVGASGILGQDNAAVFRELLQRKNIHEFFTFLPGETRTSIKVQDLALGTTTDINLPGLCAGPQSLEKLLANTATLNPSWVVLAGSLPPGLNDKVYYELIRHFRSRGCLVALDCSGASLQAALPAQPDLIKPNVHELEELLQRRLETTQQIKEAALTLVQGGIGTVVVSRGEMGALFATASGVVEVRPQASPILSTVGAGDAMVAGMVCGHLRGMDLETTARLATAFAMEALGRLEAGLAQFSHTLEIASQLASTRVQ